MEPETEGRLVSDRKVISHRTYKRVGLTFVGLCFLVGALYTGYMYYAAPILIQEQAEQFLVQLTNEMEKSLSIVEYSIVPRATSTLVIPAPADIQVEQLQSDYTTARAGLEINKDAKVPSIYDLPVGDITYLEYLSNAPLEIQTPLYQMHHELRGVTKHFNRQYSQQSVAARIGKPEEVAYESMAMDAEGKLSFYPSRNVVEARFISEMLARQFPSMAVYVREYANSFINDGIAYGHYTAAEAAVAIQLADDYLAQAEQNQATTPVLQSLEE